MTHAWSSRLTEQQKKDFDEVCEAFCEHGDLDDLHYGLVKCGLTDDEAEHYVNQITGDAPVD